MGLYQGGLSFFANEKVSEDKIMADHCRASALRTQAIGGPILVLQDTTEFSFKRAAPEKIGFTKEVGKPPVKTAVTQLWIC